MPFTLNGIGTHYVGKKNLLRRPGACGHCGRWTTLESYDTRECFVLLFVPLVPLARYHILDKCAACTRHLRLRAAVWEAQQTEARLAAQSLLRGHPGDPRSAIDAHRRLAAFQLTRDAADLEASMGRQFGGNAEVLVYLGQVAGADGRGTEALRNLERAHLADPANAGAREGLALAAVQGGELDRGLELLKPVLESRTLQGAGAGCALASALVAAARFEEAERVLGALLERFPALAEVKDFARDLERCEKALGRPRTQLAVLRRARRKWIAAGAFAALVVAAVLVADVAAGRRIKLYVVESASGRVQVEVPGAGALDFRSPGVHVLELPAGTYRARVTGTVEREVEFTLASHAWPRFLDDTVNVLDATGNSLLVVEQATYSARDDGQGFGRHVLFGEDFRELEEVDIAFDEFPRTLLVKGSNTKVRKTRVDLLRAPLEGVVYGLIAEKDVRTALSLATWGMGQDAEVPGLLECYLDAVRAAHAEKQAAAFLAPRLARRPVDLALHQASIALASGAAEQEQARQRYRELRQREPGEPAWPWLLAILSPRISERRELLGPVVREDSPPPLWRTLAETQAADAQWSLALESAQTALSRPDHDSAAAVVRLEALGALGRGAELDREYEELLDQDPCNVWVALRHFERLPAGTPAAELVRSLTQWLGRARASCRDSFRVDSVAYVHAWCALGQGDVDTIARLEVGVKDHSLRWLLASALADKGRLIEARQYLKGKLRCEIEPYDALALALACRVGGDEAQGAEWEARALPQLSAPVDAEVARLLAGERRGVAAEALDLALPPWRKAVVLALVSLADERSRVELLDLALRLQARPIFPRRIIEELAAKTVRR